MAGHDHKPIKTSCYAFAHVIVGATIDQDINDLAGVNHGGILHRVHQHTALLIIDIGHFEGAAIHYRPARIHSVELLRACCTDRHKAAAR